MESKYKQNDGYDKFRNTEEGNWSNSGKAVYDTDGSLKRLDIYSPSSTDANKHHHEWINKKDDGTYEYGHGEHDNH